MTARSLLACAALLPAVGLLIAAEPPLPGGGAPTLDVHAVDTDRGCRITVKAQNTDSEDIWLWSENSRVRTRQGVLAKFWGPWKKPLPMSNRRIRPNELATMTMELDLSCDRFRQYEFHFWKGTKSNAVTRCYGGDKGTKLREIRFLSLASYFQATLSEAKTGC